MHDGLSDYMKKKLTLPLTIELHDPKEKVFHNAPVSPTRYALRFKSGPEQCKIFMKDLLALD